MKRALLLPKLQFPKSTKPMGFHWPASCSACGMWSACPLPLGGQHSSTVWRSQEPNCRQVVHANKEPCRTVVPFPKYLCFVTGLLAAGACYCWLLLVAGWRWVLAACCLLLVAAAGWWLPMKERVSGRRLLPVVCWLNTS